MNVLSVASEVYPLIKTGGLADVAGALPPALAKLGIATRTLVPGYPAVLAKLPERARVLDLGTLFGGSAWLAAARAFGLDLLVLEASHLFERPGGPYGDPFGQDWPDNWRRFAGLARAAASIAEGSLPDWRPDLVHAHDWQAGMTPAYLTYGAAAATPSVMTVHNLAFQGQFPTSIFGELGLPPRAFSVDGVEYYNSVGFLKAGLQYASAITTVSPTYAREIHTPEFGMGLDGLIRARSEVVHGIVNGIDVGEWGPAADPFLEQTYSARTLKLRERNRQAVEQRFGLTAGDGPLFAVVSRLTWQKGMDLLPAIVDGLVGLGGSLAVLGSGDQALEGALLAAAARHRGRVGVVLGYDEGLSHLLQGGADAILIPSRFEPCGLTQLYGLRYGCVPVVTRTGGLADTVIDANEAAVLAGAATGFQFGPLNAQGFMDALARVVTLYADRPRWTALQKAGMRSDVSWQRSAARYADLYRSLGAAG